MMITINVLRVYQSTLNNNTINKGDTTMSEGPVITQEQLMKVKIKYLEDRITTMEKSLSRD